MIGEMMRHFAIFLAAFLAASCAYTPQGASSPTIVSSVAYPDHTFSQRTVRTLNSMTYIEEVPVTVVGYKPGIRCAYELDASTRLARRYPPSLLISFNNVAEKIHVTHSSGEYVSSVVMEADGRPQNFNVFDPAGNLKSTQLAADTVRVKQSMRARGDTKPRVVMNLFLYLPEYKMGQWTPGMSVANINDTDGLRFANYVYRGMGNIGVDRVALLDLIVTDMTDINVGKNIGKLYVNPITMMPVYFIGETRGFYYKLSRKLCDNL